MKIISWNVNGLRAVYKRNFLEWFKKTNADIVCLQEIKAQIQTLSQDLIKVNNYHSYFNFADKKGYSGVAIYTKEKPIRTRMKLELKRFDKEGRILELKYPKFSILNTYLPHGGRQKENLKYKLEVYGHFLDYLKAVKNKKLILIGDFNIAHKEIDLARPKQNKNNIMFTMEERKQINEITEFGFTDTFRKFHKEGGNYTWWPYFASARIRNLGWRIDYIFTSAQLTNAVKRAFILKNVKGSDHCPIGIEIKI
jgi:exodeoxyribonuclease-3